MIPHRSNKDWNARAIPERVKFRASSKWVAEGECMISTYSVGSHGYAQIGWQSRFERATVLAHRASWEYTMGPVPEGYTLDHVCKNHRCVNVAHLRILPNYENARRTSGRDWPLGQCVNGHPNSELREYSVGAGKTKLRCRLCAREWQRTYRKKKRELAS